MQERIRNLDKAENTYEQRINNERQHAAAQRNALQERYDQEVKLRKELEEKLKAIEKSRRPRSQNRGRGSRAQGIVHSNWRVNPASVHLDPAGPNCTLGPTSSRPPLPLHVEIAGGVGMQRRKSYLPVPSRPSTPIRPPCSRDPPSNSSTLVSSVHSTFPRLVRPLCGPRVRRLRIWNLRRLHPLRERGELLKLMDNRRFGL
jgi:hypothetical protein